MSHIKLPEGRQGIRGPMAFRPETAKPLNELVEVLLHAPNSLPQGDRELIATYVSSLNDCYFCQTVHGSIAAACLNGDEDIVRQVKHDFRQADISKRLKALLVIAGKVQKDGKLVTAEDLPKPGNKAPATSKFTIRFLSPPLSRCTTATSTGWIPGSRRTRRCTANAARKQRVKVTSR